LIFCRSLLQNNDQNLWWTTISRVYEDDTNGQLRRTKLRDEHVRLTPASRMSVRLAVQVSIATCTIHLVKFLLS